MVNLIINVKLCTAVSDKLSVDLDGSTLKEHVLSDIDYATRAILGEFYDREYDLVDSENHWPYSRKFYLNNGSMLEVNLSKTAHQVKLPFPDIGARRGDYGIYNVVVNDEKFDSIWEAIDFAIELICEEGENRWK